MEKNPQTARGMRLAASLPDITLERAGARLRPVYEDIQDTLRVPMVDSLFRILANYPDYLEHTWSAVRPIVRTLAFESAADELRTLTYFEPVFKDHGLDWEDLGYSDSIRAFNDTIHYVLPKLLLTAYAFEASRRTASVRDRISTLGVAAEIKAGIAPGTTRLQMIDPHQASGQVVDLFDSIKQRHNLPLISSYYRGLGLWPDFLKEVWQKIEPLVGGFRFEERKKVIIAGAEVRIRDLPLAGTNAVRLDEKDETDIQDIIAAFRLKFIPEMMIDVAMVKSMLDGAQTVRFSRFSVA